MPDPDARLRDFLGADVPASIAALPESTRAELAAVVLEARARQEADLIAAFDTTLRHLPFPLRSLVKKMLL